MTLLVQFLSLAICGMVVLLTMFIIILGLRIVFGPERAAMRAAVQPFSCQRCGRCCQLLVRVNRADRRRLEARLPGSSCHSIIWRFGLAWLRREPRSQSCVFLERDSTGLASCQVYAARPATCQRFPHLNYGICHGQDRRCPAVAAPAPRPSGPATP